MDEKLETWHFSWEWDPSNVSLDLLAAKLLFFPQRSKFRIMGSRQPPHPTASWLEPCIRKPVLFLLNFFMDSCRIPMCSLIHSHWWSRILQGQKFSLVKQVVFVAGRSAFLKCALYVCSAHFQDVPMYNNHIQKGLKKNWKRATGVLKADNSKRHSGISRYEQAGHFRKLGIISENGKKLGGNPDEPVSSAFRHKAISVSCFRNAQSQFMKAQRCCMSRGYLKEHHPWLCNSKANFIIFHLPQKQTKFLYNARENVLLWDFFQLVNDIKSN